MSKINDDDDDDFIRGTTFLATEAPSDSFE